MLSNTHAQLKIWVVAYKKKRVYNYMKAHVKWFTQIGLFSYYSVYYNDVPILTKIRRPYARRKINHESLSFMQLFYSCKQKGESKSTSNIMIRNTQFILQQFHLRHLLETFNLNNNLETADNNLYAYKVRYVHIL